MKITTSGMLGMKKKYADPVPLPLDQVQNLTDAEVGRREKSEQRREFLRKFRERGGVRVYQILFSGLPSTRENDAWLSRPPSLSLTTQKAKSE